VRVFEVIEEVQNKEIPQLDYFWVDLPDRGRWGIGAGFHAVWRPIKGVIQAMTSIRLGN